MEGRVVEELVEMGRQEGFDVITDEKKLRGDYTHDKSSHPPTTHPPAVAVLPRNAEQVAQIVRTCRRAGVPLTVRGAGTGVEGGAIPYSGGVVLSTAALTRIAVDLANGLCWVGAGVKKLQLEAELKRQGRMFGPDPSSNPSIGGMASTGSSGMTTLRYGTMRENVISLLVVTAEGDVMQTRRAVRKSSTGLDLTHLYLGAEGTLGVIVEVCIKIHHRPSLSSGALLAFPSTAHAVRTVVGLVNGEHPPLQTLCRCELLNAEGVRCTNKYFSAQLTPAPTLLVEFVSNEQKAMENDWVSLHAIAAANECVPSLTQHVSSGQELEKIWEARRGCYLAAFAYRDVEGDRVYMADVCVPLTHLTRCIAETEADFEKAKIPCIICAHIADGNFHCLVPYNTPAEEHGMHDVTTRLVERAVEMGGSVSGEHGIGVGKVRFLLAEHGRPHCLLQRRIKACLDPLNILNPGKYYIHSHL